MANNICWKHHKSVSNTGAIPYEIIEFIYKNTSKVLKIDSLNWEYNSEKILDWIKNNWEGIHTSIDHIDVTIEVKE